MDDDLDLSGPPGSAPNDEDLTLPKGEFHRSMLCVSVCGAVWLQTCNHFGDDTLFGPLGLTDVNICSHHYKTHQ